MLTKMLFCSSEIRHLRVVYLLPFNISWYSQCLQVTECGEKMQNLKYSRNSTEKTTPEKANGSLARIPLWHMYIQGIQNSLMSLWILNRFWSCKKQNRLYNSQGSCAVSSSRLVFLQWIHTGQDSFTTKKCLGLHHDLKKKIQSTARLCKFKPHFQAHIRGQKWVQQGRHFNDT